MRILVVEDEKAILDFLKISFEAEGFAVDMAEDGEKGLALAKANPYDIMVLDNMLPKKTGLEICKELRQSKNNTPIIMLSVRQEVMTKVDLLNAGADDYLTKPFSFFELLARIRALMRRPNNIASDILQIDDLVIDTKKHLAVRGGEPVHLTKKEFALLEYLMKNEGLVVSRGMIMDHIWDMNADPFSNTVESHVSNLRKKIDLDGKLRLIKTISGKGYKIDTSLQ